MQRFRGGIAFKAHRLCVPLNSRLESNQEQERISGKSGTLAPARARSQLCCWDFRQQQLAPLRKMPLFDKNLSTSLIASLCGGHPHPLNLRIEGTRHTVWEDGRPSGSNKRRCDAPARGASRGAMRYANYPEVDRFSGQALLRRNDLA